MKNDLVPSSALVDLFWSSKLWVVFGLIIQLYACVKKECSFLFSAAAQHIVLLGFPWVGGWKLDSINQSDHGPMLGLDIKIKASQKEHLRKHTLQHYDNFEWLTPWIYFPELYNGKVIFREGQSTHTHIPKLESERAHGWSVSYYSMCTNIVGLTREAQSGP